MATSYFLIWGLYILLSLVSIPPLVGKLGLAINGQKSLKSQALWSTYFISVFWIYVSDISTGYNKNVLLSFSIIPHECVLGTSLEGEVVAKTKYKIALFFFFFA